MSIKSFNCAMGLSLTFYAHLQPITDLLEDLQTNDLVEFLRRPSSSCCTACCQSDNDVARLNVDGH